MPPESPEVSRFLHHGRLLSMPRRWEHRKAVARWLAHSTLPDLLEPVTEPELTRRLAALAADPVGVRRAMVDLGLVHRTRDGAEYWRTELTEYDDVVADATASSLTSTDNGDGTYTVPLLNADVPDVAVERVPAAQHPEGRGVYYMVSTTMHLSPGAPIMKSYDLVSWEIVSYVFDRLDLGDAFALRNGQSSYGQGQWASSLRLHDGVWYVLFNTNNLGGAYLYRTDDVENGSWERVALGRALHDPSLFFDVDGTPYVFYGSGGMSAVRLSPDLTAIEADLPDIVTAADLAGQPGIGGLFEGVQMHRIDGWYCAVVITWPPGEGRQVVMLRSRELLRGYEARRVLDSNGFAQGGLVPVAREDGVTDWWGMFFRDDFPLGRVPALVPARWVDGWPVFGDDGVVPVGGTFRKPIRLTPEREAVERAKAIVASDEFDDDAPHRGYLEEALGYPPGPETDPNGSRLGLVWQWNHAPDNRHWSLTARPGWLRLTTGHVVTGEYVSRTGAALTWLEEARNTLTQRTVGPRMEVETRLDVSGLTDGDTAGLTVFNRGFSYVAVRQEGGARVLGVVHRGQPFDDVLDHAAVEAFLPGTSTSLGEVTDVRLRAALVFGAGELWTRFAACLDGVTWNAVGGSVGPQVLDGTLSHFMGHRIGLFAYATRKPGGYVDFDYFRVGPTLWSDRTSRA